MKLNLTYNHRLLLKYIINELETGQCPSYREMMRYMGFTAIQSVRQKLLFLERSGLIRIPEGKHIRQIHVTDLGYTTVDKMPPRIKCYYRLKGATDNASPSWIPVTAEWSRLRRD